MSMTAIRSGQAHDEMMATVRAVYDQEAGGDDPYAGDLGITAAQREAWSVLLRRLFPPETPLRIVDVGCGFGLLTLALAELGHTVTGIDLSSPMIDVCRSEVERRAATGIDLVQAEAEEPPTDLGPVDVVISRYLLWTLPRPERAVRAWAGLVRPGGRVVGIDALWTPELVRESVSLEYPPEIVRLLPLLHARELEPVHNAWRRAGLVDVTTEEQGWLNGITRSEVAMGVRPIFRQMNLYLVEGTRPAKEQS